MPSLDFSVDDRAIVMKSANIGRIDLLTDILSEEFRLTRVEPMRSQGLSALRSTWRKSLLPSD